MSTSVCYCSHDGDACMIFASSAKFRIAFRELHATVPSEIAGCGTDPTFDIGS